MSGHTRPFFPHAVHVPAAVVLMLALGGCRREPPPTEHPPEPQAHAAQADTGLRDAIQAPQDQAKATGDALQQGAEAQRAQIEAAEGG